MVITVYFILLFEGIVLGIDTIWTIKSGITVTRRNNKVMLDISLDFLSACVPILIMRFAYGLPFTEEEFVILGCVPALFSLSKLYEIVDAIIRERAVVYLNIYKEKSLKVRRLSFFQSFDSIKDEDENEKIAQMQMKHTPKIVHYIFLFFLSIYILFLITTIIVQLATFSTIDCNKDISPFVWKDCTVKLYFCNKIFQPQCNCAIIDIEGHNMTTLNTNVFRGLSLSATLLLFIYINDTVKNKLIKRFKTNHTFVYCMFYVAYCIKIIIFKIYNK
tara:strand:- start:2283 stop:3107 length:825 start_codon:yes stop_codon:yes gene_type:complete